MNPHRKFKNHSLGGLGLVFMALILCFVTFTVLILDAAHKNNIDKPVTQQYTIDEEDRKLNNLIQKWILYHPEKHSFITHKPFNYTTDPNLARIYHNYSDAILACHNHYDKEFGAGHYPIELRMHFNTETLKIVEQEDTY